jgi:iron(III) transport system substrate-binding protein
LKWYDFPHAVAYNINNVSAADVPQSYEDLLKPRFANGRLANESQSSYAVAFQLDPTWGQARAVAFTTDLAKQAPLEEQRADLGLQDIITGQADVATVGVAALLQAKAQGAPVEIAPISPQMPLPFGLFVPRGATHQAGAELFALWLLTPDARRAWETKAYYAPVAPCNASQVAQYLCSKNISMVTYHGFDEVSATVDFIGAYRKAWASSKETANYRQDLARMRKRCGTPITGPGNVAFTLSVRDRGRVGGSPRTSRRAREPQCAGSD